MNKVILIGNLGKDPESRSTPSGTSVTTFSMATNMKWRGKDGEQKEDVQWHNIVCWKGIADVAARYLSKGSKVCVEGRLATRSWEDRNTGEKKYRTEIVCERLEMLGGGSGDGNGGRPSDPPDDEYNEDDDIPF